MNLSEFKGLLEGKSNYSMFREISKVIENCLLKYQNDLQIKKD